MAIGILVASDLCDFTQLPFKELKGIKKFKPSSGVLWQEIQCRSKLFSIPLPRYENKNGTIKKEWLCQNPVTKADNIDYVVGSIKLFRGILEAQMEVNCQLTSNTTSATAWHGNS